MKNFILQSTLKFWGKMKLKRNTLHLTQNKITLSFYLDVTSNNFLKVRVLQKS